MQGKKENVERPTLNVQRSRERALSAVIEGGDDGFHVIRVIRIDEVELGLFAEEVGIVEVLGDEFFQILGSGEVGGLDEFVFNHLCGDGVGLSGDFEIGVILFCFREKHGRVFGFEGGEGSAGDVGEPHFVGGFSVGGDMLLGISGDGHIGDEIGPRIVGENGDEALLVVAWIFLQPEAGELSVDFGLLGVAKWDFKTAD